MHLKRRAGINFKSYFLPYVKFMWLILKNNISVDILVVYIFCFSGDVVGTLLFILNRHKIEFSYLNEYNCLNS